MFPPVPNNLRNQRIKWIKEGDSNFSRSCLNTSSLVSENIDIRYFIKLNGIFIHTLSTVGYSYYRTLISISTVDTLDFRIYKNILFHIFLWSKLPSTPDWVRLYYAGYQIKLKLICRLIKDRDQALISIFTIQEFHSNSK